MKRNSLRDYNVKEVKKISPVLSSEFNDLTLLKGGSIKDFVGKAKNFIKTKVKPVAQKIYGKVKQGVDFLANTEKGQKIVNGVAKVASKVASFIPGVSAAAPVIEKFVPEIVNKVDKGMKSVETLAKNITQQSPTTSFNEAKTIVKSVKDTYNSIKEDFKKSKDSQALAKLKEKQKMIEQNLPDAVKENGSGIVLKVARYLPMVDLQKIKSETTKAGKLKFKISKPPKAMIVKYLGDEANKNYNATAMNKVGGRLFMKGVGSLGGSCGEDKSDVGGRTTLTGSGMSLEDLRKKYEK